MNTYVDGIIAHERYHKPIDYLGRAVTKIAPLHSGH